MRLGRLWYSDFMSILPLDWMAILGIRFGRFPIPTSDMSFELARKLLGILLPLTTDTGGYFGPTTLPQIRTEWMAPTDIHLR